MCPVGSAVGKWKVPTRRAYVSSVSNREYPNRKLPPIAGAGVLLTRFHPDYRQGRYLVGPVTRPVVHLTLSGFQGYARGGFSAVEAGTGSQSLAGSPCQHPGRVLVPVTAFYDLCGRNRTRTYDLCDVNAML